MALRIVRESDPITVTQLVFCIYAPPGIGKTSLGFTADDPFLIDFDKGGYRTKNRRGDMAAPDCWEDVLEIDAKVLAASKTLIIDTAGRALDMLTSDIIAKDAKAGRGGVLNRVGFGKLKGGFLGWQSHIKTLGKDIVLLAHSDEQGQGEEVTERIDVQGGSKQEIYKSADVMGRLKIVDGKRMLNFSPTDTAYGKNPAGFGPIEVPDFSDDPNFLGRLIRETKENLNALSANQVAAATSLETWKAKVDAAQTPTDFDTLREEVNVADVSASVRSVLKRMIVDTAAKKGLKFDKSENKFVLKAA